MSHLLLRFLAGPVLVLNESGLVPSKALAMADEKAPGLERSLAPDVTEPSASSSESLDDSYILRLAA